MNYQVDIDYEHNVEQRNLIHKNKELLRKESETNIAKCLGPIMFIGIIFWLLIFSLINYMIFSV